MASRDSRNRWPKRDRSGWQRRCIYYIDKEATDTFCPLSRWKRGLGQRGAGRYGVVLHCGQVVGNTHFPKETAAKKKEEKKKRRIHASLLFPVLSCLYPLMGKEYAPFSSSLCLEYRVDLHCYSVLPFALHRQPRHRAKWAK
jgi:hypothetical protein